MRRALIIAIAVVAAAATGIYFRFRTPDPEPYGLRLVRFEIDSAFVDDDLEQVAIVPEGGPRRPLLMFLHGRSASPNEMLSEELFAALESQGASAPIVLLVNGGESSYFHDRDDGDWGSYVTKELILEARRKFKVESVAIGGISMGGFGALDLARLNPHLFCAVGAHSPAIFASAGETAEGAFDDAEDFASHDLLTFAREDSRMYQGLDVWIDVGTEDPFLDSTISFAETLDDDVRFSRREGGHDGAYWRRNMDEYIAFYTHALEDC